MVTVDLERSGMIGWSESLLEIMYTNWQQELRLTYQNTTARYYV